ncbi:hypothetical protein TNCT_331191 [Trichonephila clavata]|uniref:Uncharacterized protein n=1 Tax=Trichonephila clavata TaxID=2740835 RepID=A0A8X6GQF6_TRICU|nr:hypothetical protein TNCT_331191 [Trichonephila clavata]
MYLEPNHDSFLRTKGMLATTATHSFLNRKRSKPRNLPDRASFLDGESDRLVISQLFKRLDNKSGLGKCEECDQIGAVCRCDYQYSKPPRRQQ